MLGKSSQKNTADDMTVAKVDKDLIVHNMPSQAIFKTPAAPKSISGSRFLSSVDKKNNFKVVGGIIIAGGVIFVGTLIYLSYYFIIKPRIATPGISVPAPVVNVENPVQNNEAITVVATSTEATTTTLTETDPNILNLINNSNASSTASASSTDPALDGEGLVDMPPILDTDTDGLNDDEEAILGTNMAVVDTDSDSYSDLSEIQKGYSPTGINKKLYPNEFSNKYDNKAAKYSLYYPKAWDLKALNNDYTVIISVPDNSLIQISVSDNPNIQNIAAWYAATFPGETVTSDRIKNSSSWEGIMGADGLNFYLTGKDRDNIYVISYIPSISGRVVYPNIFKMIIDSFVLNK
jgi:hypothetical protein